MTICIVGDREDLSSAYVTWLARARGDTVHVLDEATLGETWSFTRAAAGDVLEVEDARVELDEVTGVFVRLNPEPGVPNGLDLGPEAAATYVTERRQGLQWWLQSLTVPVVNRPDGGRSNGSKPFQMARLATRGCEVPDWVCTNDLDRAEDFVADHPTGVVVKSCSGLRSRVRLFDDDMRARLRAGTTPVVLQARITGTEARVHVVGERTFATGVRSDEIDYRWGPVAPEYVPVEVPDTVVAQCREMTASEGLAMSGTDFRIDDGGRWWWLEMNPVPTFLPYEAGSGHRIGDAVVDLLTPTPSSLVASPIARVDAAGQS